MTAWLRQLECRLIRQSKYGEFEGGSLPVRTTNSIGSGRSWLNSELREAALSPTQTTEFLGFLINSQSMEIRIPEEKMLAIQEAVKRILAAKTVSGRHCRDS